MARSIFHSVGVLLLITAIASAQTATAVKIGVINSFAFEDRKSGIVGLVRTIDAVPWELGGYRGYYSKAQRLEELGKEMAQSTTDVAAKATKFEEAEELKREIAAIEKEYKASYDKRFNLVVRPVMDDIANALRDFAKEHHYGMIFDIAKDDDGLLAIIGDEKVDMTKDFIAYYNARTK